jgi:hypothetical protein
MTCNQRGVDKRKSLRHKLRAVVNDTALAIGSVPAEGTFDPHAVLQIGRAADNPGGPLRSLAKLIIRFN